MKSVTDSFVEVKLHSPDYFLKVKETLQRIGVASNKDKTLIQSVHILHKRGKYYLVHFKQLFELDGKKSTMTENDYDRLVTIAGLLHEWELVDLVNEDLLDEEGVPISQIKILSFKEKKEWTLIQKYSLGKEKSSQN